MNITNPMFTQPSYPISFQPPMTGHLGYQIDVPHAPPVATPFYYGEDPQWGRRELVMRSDPEYFAIGNVVPMLTEKIPLVDISDPSYSFSRAKFTFHL